jgi:hypothetical protein
MLCCLYWTLRIQATTEVLVRAAQQQLNIYLTHESVFCA